MRSERCVCSSANFVDRRFFLRGMVRLACWATSLILCCACEKHLSDMKVNPTTLAVGLATLMVAIGWAHLRYGYYMLLRLFLGGISLFLLLGAGLRLEAWHRWALGIFAVVYHPVLPVRLGEKSVWIILNIATVVLFWIVVSLSSNS